MPIGRSREFEVPALSAAVARAAPIGALRCGPASARRFALHLELYARGLVLPVPAGIGVAPPQRRAGAYVLGGSCVYPLHTLEPTGLVLVDQARPLALASLFAVWGQPLSSHSLAGFQGPVRAFLAGRAWRGAPGAIPLTRHAEIVIESGRFVIPHRRYHFPPGL